MTMALVLHRADGASVSSTAFRRAAFGKDDPFARHREIAWEGPGAMSAGRTSFIGEIEVASYPHIETIVVVEGELTLTAAGAAPLVVGPQAGVVIGCGTSLHIQAGSRVRFVFCAAACEKPTQRRVAGAMTRATAARTAGNRLRIPVWNSSGSSSTIRNWLNVKPPGTAAGGTGVLMR